MHGGSALNCVKRELYTVTQAAAVEVLFTLKANRRLSLPANCPRAYWAELSDSWRRLKHDAFPRQQDNPILHTPHTYTDYQVTPLVSANSHTTKHLYGNVETQACTLRRFVSWQLAWYVAFSPGDREIYSIQEVLLFISSTQQMFGVITPGVWHSACPFKHLGYPSPLLI